MSMLTFLFTLLQVDDVDEVLANINEQNDAMEQINAAMGQPIGPSADIDEDDLEAEFAVRWMSISSCASFYPSTPGMLSYVRLRCSIPHAP